MATAAQYHRLPYETYAEGYARHCPICYQIWPSAKGAVLCWYQHQPDALAKISYSALSEVMGITAGHARRIWSFLKKKHGAPTKLVESLPSDRYYEVVRYLKGRRSKHHAPRRGWTSQLAQELGVSKQRISQYAQRAKTRGDI